MRCFLTILAALAVTAACSRAEHTPDWFSEIRSANKLVLASMSISKMATIDDMDFSKAKGFKQSADALMASLKVGDRVAAYSYDTYLKAYIDLSDLSPDDVKVDEDSKTITIMLPPVQTEFAGRDLGMREEHYRVTGLRSQINAKERAEIKEKMNASLKTEVENDPAFKNILIDRAKKQAVMYFDNMFAGTGYTPVVVFKPSITLLPS